MSQLVKKTKWLWIVAPVAVVLAIIVVGTIKVAPDAFVKIFSDPGALATLLGAILATLGIPFGVWLSSSYERRRKEREAKAEMANEVLSLVSMVIHEIIENFRFPIGKSEGETKLLIERYNDLSWRLAEALHRANYILDPKDLESYVALRSLMDKFFISKRAEWYNQNKKETQTPFFPYPLQEFMGILYKNPTDDAFGNELSKARTQMEQVFRKYTE